MISDYSMQKSILISSFSPECIRQCRSLAPEVATGVLYDKRAYKREDPVKVCRELGVNSLHLKKRSATRKRIHQAREKVIPVLVYTVNRKRSMKKLIQKGVKGIFTDKPALLKETLNELVV